MPHTSFYVEQEKIVRSLFIVEYQNRPPITIGVWRLCWLAVVASGLLAACSAKLSAEDRIMQRVRQRVATRPDDPVAWRMLGKLLLTRGDPTAAADALRRAIELDPDRVAAHFDLAECHAALGHDDLAAASFGRVVELAPDSDEARRAQANIEQLAPEDSPFRLANFQPRWVEAPVREGESLSTVLEPSPWKWRLETGVLYNSNVDLAPISRQLSTLENGGFQATFAPEIEYVFMDDDHLRGGWELESFFAVNQPDNDQFNLQHYRPGIYFDFPFFHGHCEVIPQLRYDFAYDIFAGATLGTRHELTASVATIAADGSSWVFYLSGDDTDFRNDGADPAEDSLDGSTYTIGLVRQWACIAGYVDDVQLAVDGQWADLRGANQTYAGFFALLSSTCPVGECWELRPEAGMGFRSYPDFVGAPSRDETIWRAGAEMRRWLSDHRFVSGTFYYDRFDSDNAEYSAERFTAGASLTLLH